MKADDIIKEWAGQGRKYQVFGHDVFAVDTGRRDLPVLLLLHGYPSSSFDYRHVIPLLKDQFRIIVHDHLGFGMSDKPLKYSYSLFEQADVCLELWRQLEVKTAHLAAHDYGTSVATELLARRMRSGISPSLESVTLSNGSIHIEMADLRFIQKLLRHAFWGPIVGKLGNEAIFVHQMRRLWHDRNKCDVEELKALWAMNSSGNGRKVLPKVTQYLHERYRFWHRWIGALESLNLPAHILWAQEDPVAVKAIGEQLYQEIPNAEITRLEGIGHYPMLEKPAIWAQFLQSFVESLINRK